MYCTVGEVLEMIKDDMKNVIIGDEYIEDEQEREAKIARHHRSSTNLQKTYLYTTLYQGQV